MTVVTMPDGVAVDFKDLPPDQIKSLIQQKYPDAVKQLTPGAGIASRLSTISDEPQAASAEAPLPAVTGEAEPDRGFFGSLLHELNPATAANNAIYGGSGINEAVAQGASFGLTDEARGVVGGAISAAQGKGFGEGYDEQVGEARAGLAKFNKEHPLIAGASELTGALATLPFTGAANVVRVPQVATKLAPVGTKIATTLARTGAKAVNAGTTGAIYGGLYGAGTAEGGPKERLIGGGIGAGLGTVTGLTLPIATSGLQWITQKAFGKPLQALGNKFAPQAQAKKALRKAIVDDAATQGITPQRAVADIEAAQARGVPMTALDIGESTRNLGTFAKTRSPQGRDVLTETVDQRFETQADRFIDSITAHAPGVNAPERSTLNKAAAKLTNRRNYNQAYADGANGVWNEELESLTSSPTVRSAIKDAITIGADEAAERGQRQPLNPFAVAEDGTLTRKFEFSQTPDGNFQFNKGATPTLEFWDHVKRAIDGQIQIQRASPEVVGRLTSLKNKLVDILDREVPSYRQARSTASSFFGSDDALEAGKLFVTRRGDNPAARKALAQMTPAEKELFGEGFATEYINKLRNVRDRQNVINHIYESPAAKERFRMALGDKGADAMEATVRLEDVMEKARRAVTGGSDTAQKLIAQSLVGAGAGYITGGGELNMTSIITGLLTVGLTKSFHRGIDRASVQMARELAEMLASQNPQIMKQAIAKISNQPAMMDALRKGHTWITRALTPTTVDKGSKAFAPGAPPTMAEAEPAPAY